MKTQRLNKLYYIGLFINTLVLFTSCSAGSHNKSSEAFFQNETCISDSTNSYFVYLPSGISSKQKLPLVVVLDPHGSGEYAVRKLIPASEEYKCILVGSNQVKNGYIKYIESIENLISDVRRKYNLDDQIYLAGFSGGARMALKYSSFKKINGLIISGAGIGNEVPGGSPVYSIFGLADFNLLETAQYILNPGQIPEKLRIEITETIHEWPSKEVLKKDIGFLLLENDLKYGTKNMQESEQLSFFREGKTVVDSMLDDGKYIQAYLLCNNYLSLKDEDANNLFFPVFNKLKVNSEYNSELKQFHSSLLYELREREAYIKAFERNEIDWWMNEIDKLKSEKTTNENYYISFTHKRIIAFLGIACYSYTKSFLTQNKLSAAEKVLTIYKTLEPENAEMYFYWSMLWHKKGNEGKAIENLKKAIGLGYNDFSEISSIFGKEILGKLPN